MKLNFKMFKDMLTEKVGNEKLYSQGRVYLLWSVAAYYITLGFISVKAMRPDMTIGMEPLKVIIEALQWAMALFATYVFGGKGIEMVKAVMGKGANGKNTAPSNGTGADGPAV